MSPSFFDGGSTGEIPPWLLNNPGEYSEMILAQLLRLKNTHQIEANYVTILNEAGNNNPVTPQVVRSVIRALGPRMNAAGLTTKVQAPECISANTSWTYINGSPNGLRYDAAAWRYIGLLSYHLYGGNDQKSLIRDLGFQQGIPTAQDPELAVTTFHWAVIRQPGGASVVISTPNAASSPVTGFSVAGDYVFSVDVSDGINTVIKELLVTAYSGNQPPGVFDVHNRMPVYITLPVETTILRGAGRDLEGDALSFQWSILSQPTGANVTLASPAATECVARGLSIAGNYRFLFTVSEAGQATRDTLDVPVYPVNQNAPVISSITPLPNDTVSIDTVSLNAVTSDPDGDMISHWWAVKSAPAGVQPVIVRPGGAGTVIRNLSAPGTYVFTLIVVDRTRMTTRDISIVQKGGSAVMPSGTQPFLDFSLRPIFSGHDLFFRLATDMPGKVSLRMFDAQGRVVWIRVTNFRTPGYATVVLGSIMPAGCYFLELAQNGRSVVTRFIVAQ